MNAKKLLIIGSLVAGFWMTSPAGYAQDNDARIESSTKQSYVYRTYLKDDAIAVHSTNGVVTLSGTVDSTAHKQMAEDVVDEMPGVKSVDNRIKVTTEDPKQPSDTWLASKIKTTLLFHKNVSGIKTNVEVKDGVAVLTGDATSIAQKDLTTQYARDVEGVKSVVNRMAVVGEQPKPTSTMKEDAKASMRDMGDKIDDASITTQIKMMLLGHRSTSALKTTVHTKDGVVSISGPAKNDAEHDLVTKLAEDVHGVRRVENSMVIAPEAR